MSEQVDKNRLREEFFRRESERMTESSKKLGSQMPVTRGVGEEPAPLNYHRIGTPASHIKNPYILT